MVAGAGTALGIPNGADFDEIVSRFAAGGGAEVAPVRDQTVLLAVQGPDAEVVEQVVGTMPKRFRVMATEYAGEPCWMAGTGYAGEKGVEVAVPVATGVRLYRELVDAGAAPCGLGARDALRLEMGYPLWGQDLDGDTTPLEAGLGWVVAWDHDFVGRAALERRAQRRDRQAAGRLRARRPAGASPRFATPGGGEHGVGGQRQLQPGAGPWYRDGVRDATHRRQRRFGRGAGSELPGRRVEPPFIAQA